MIAVVAAGRETVGRRREQVVGLPASRLHLMDSGRREHLSDHRELLTEGVGVDSRCALYSGSAS